MPQIQRETGSSLSEINMVPFIDVVLVLLIIFMITAPILQSGIDVDVPKTKTVKELTTKTCSELIDEMVITETKILLGEMSYSIGQVADLLHFSNKFIFSKFFKNRTGLSPKEYRY